MRVAFHTLGCKVNHYETEAIREAFVSRGAVSVGDEDPADVYIINTCTVTNIADRKSRQYIRRVKRINPDAMIVVTGCYAQVEPEEVASLPEVDLVVGNGQKAKICDIVMERLDQAGMTDAGRTGSTDLFVLPRRELVDYEDMGLVTSSEPGMTRAYIKIQEGCDRFCAYCLIPFARGPVRSRPPGEIVQEAAMLLDAGVRELVLTGINTALYGTEPGFTYDLTDEDGNVLPGLERIAAMTPEERASVSPIEIILARLDALEPPRRLCGSCDSGTAENVAGEGAGSGESCADDSADLSDIGFRIRLSSLEPTVVDKDHVEKIIRYRRLCHHLHLSVQSGSDRVLKAMNRHYTRDEYLEIVRAIREYDPLYGITTDIIVGFPGENDEDFVDTLDIVKKADFGRVHVFRYSPRKGTAGAGLPDAVSGSVKIERSDSLEQTAAETARQFILSNMNREHIVLVEEVNDGFVTGYTDNYIRVYMKADEQITSRLGEFCRVKLTQLYKDGCMAVPV